MDQSQNNSLAWAKPEGTYLWAGGSAHSGWTKESDSLLFGSSEVLRQLRKIQHASKHIHHHLINRLQARGVHKGSGRWFTRRGRERAIFNRTSINTISRTSLKNLFKDGEERIWKFHSWAHGAHLELNWFHFISFSVIAALRPVDYKEPPQNWTDPLNWTEQRIC